MPNNINKKRLLPFYQSKQSSIRPDIDAQAQQLSSIVKAQQQKPFLQQIKNMPADNLKKTSQATITEPKKANFLARVNTQKSVMNPKKEYAKTGAQIVDFVKNEFGPDVFNELMANSGGNVEFIGRIFHDEEMQKAGKSAEEYWQEKQSQTWKDMSPGQRSVGEIVLDPMNVVTAGMGALKTVAKGFVKAGMPLFGPQTMLGLRGFFGIEDAEDVKDHYVQNIFKNKS